MGVFEETKFMIQRRIYSLRQLGGQFFIASLIKVEKVEVLRKNELLHFSDGFALEEIFWRKSD